LKTFLSIRKTVFICPFIPNPEVSFPFPDPDPTPHHFPGQGKAPKPPSTIIQKGLFRQISEAEMPHIWEK
jgi:hypothetical protein